MKRLLLALSLCLLSLIAWAATLTVALDGSQAYSSIQTAIDASNHGDTVLVYPGRYLENIRFNGKNITLASLELITGNRDYVYSTIIDANHSGTGILVIDQEASVSIRGFTVVNGSGYYVSIYDFYSGGGILIGGMTGMPTEGLDYMALESTLLSVEYPSRITTPQQEVHYTLRVPLLTTTTSVLTRSTAVISIAILQRWVVICISTT